MATLHTAALLVTLAGDEDAVAGGGVLVAGGRVAAVGEAARLAHAHPDAERVDHGDAWLIPGLRNAHGHVAGWPPDAPLEVFLLARYGAEDAERTYARTLATAADLIRSGVVLTYHLHYGGHGDAALRAYRDAGLRVQFCPGALDRFAIVPYDDDDRALLAALPPDLAAEVRRRRPGKPTEPVERYLERWRALRDAWAGDDDIEVVLGPDSLSGAPTAACARCARSGRHCTCIARRPRPSARSRSAPTACPRSPGSPVSASSPPTSRSRTSPMPPTRTSRSSPRPERAWRGTRPRTCASAAGSRACATSPPPASPSGWGWTAAGWPTTATCSRRSASAPCSSGWPTRPAPALTDRDLLAAAAGRIAPGELADLVALDPLGGDDPVAAIVRGASARNVRAVYARRVAPARGRRAAARPRAGRRPGPRPRPPPPPWPPGSRPTTAARARSPPSSPAKMLTISPSSPRPTPRRRSAGPQVTVMAATSAPSRTTAAATAAMPGSCSSSSTAKPRSRVQARSAPTPLSVTIVRGVTASSARAL